MRIVAVADTHLFTEDLALPPGDVLVHCGDLCRQGDLAELAEAAAWLLAQPHPHKIVIAGNHDWAFVHAPDEARALLPGVTYLQDQAATVAGLRVYGSPWQPAYNDWAFNLPRGPALAERWRHIPAGLDLLLTHGPPAGIGDDNLIPGRGGCQDLRDRVARAAPRLHLFGHIHQDGGFWRHGATAFANVTTWECERAATVIDLEPGAPAMPIFIPPPGR